MQLFQGLISLHQTFAYPLHHINFADTVQYKWYPRHKPRCFTFKPLKGRIIKELCFLYNTSKEICALRGSDLWSTLTGALRLDWLTAVPFYRVFQNKLTALVAVFAEQPWLNVGCFDVKTAGICNCHGLVNGSRSGRSWHIPGGGGGKDFLPCGARNNWRAARRLRSASCVSVT